MFLSEEHEVAYFALEAGAMASQLRVLYRSSSSGLDWPKSIREGSGLKSEPPGGQQKKCKKDLIEV